MHVGGPNNSVFTHVINSHVFHQNKRKRLHDNEQGVQTDATCDTQQCWELLTNNVAFICTGL